MKRIALQVGSGPPSSRVLTEQWRGQDYLDALFGDVKVLMRQLRVCGLVCS